jgi:fimbrial chaperone protein
MRLWTWRLLLAFAVLLPLRVSAYTVTPNLLILRPSGGESSTFLHLENKGQKAAAIEITINEHHKDLDGNTVADGRQADDDFIIYPAQLVMLPGDEVNAQLRWVGDAAPGAERAFTFVTREIAVPRKAGADPEGGAGIRVDVTVLVNYEGRIYVTPQGAKPEVVVESVTERTQAALLEVVLANKGTAHLSMAGMHLVLVPLGPAGAPLTQQAVTLGAKDVPGMSLHLLAGDRRRFLIPRPAALPAGPVRAMLTE